MSFVGKKISRVCVCVCVCVCVWIFRTYPLRPQATFIYKIIFAITLKEDKKQITLLPRTNVQKILVWKSLAMPAKFYVHYFVTLFKTLKNGLAGKKNRFSFSHIRYIFKEAEKKWDKRSYTTLFQNNCWKGLE